MVIQCIYSLYFWLFLHDWNHAWKIHRIFSNASNNHLGNQPFGPEVISCLCPCRIRTVGTIAVVIAVVIAVAIAVAIAIAIAIAITIAIAIAAIAAAVTDDGKRRSNIIIRDLLLSISKNNILLY